MTKVEFNTGKQEFQINDQASVSFNPTDSTVVERIYNTFEELDRKQEAYKAEIENCADKKEIFEIARRRDAEMRDMIDGLFETPVCAALFGSMSWPTVCRSGAICCLRLWTRSIHRSAGSRG